MPLDNEQVTKKPEGIDKSIVQWLLELIEWYKQTNQKQRAKIEQLEAEIRILKSNNIEQKRKLLNLDKNQWR
jgi:hypothetical protein